MKKFLRLIACISILISCTQNPSKHMKINPEVWNDKKSELVDSIINHKLLINLTPSEITKLIGEQDDGPIYIKIVNGIEYKKATYNIDGNMIFEPGTQRFLVIYFENNFCVETKLETIEI